MQRIINDPSRVVEDMIEGFVKANAGRIEKTANPRVLRAANIPAGKVGIVTGGGSGHEPAFLGYVGSGFIDAVAIGEVFSSPSPKAFYDAITAASGGAGVVVLQGNYAGDNMNIQLAIEMAQDDGIEVGRVIARDDIASAGPENAERRRGVAGEIFMWKVAAAKAAQGGTLEEVTRAAEDAIANTKSVGIGLTSCTIPAVGHPNFTIEPGKMEVGIGHHGEPGMSVGELKSANEIAAEMVEIVCGEGTFGDGDEVAVLVSGLGSTPLMELYIVYSEVESRLSAKGIRVVRRYVGNYFTSLDMMGVTLTVTKLDTGRKALLDAPCQTTAFFQ